MFRKKPQYVSNPYVAAPTRSAAPAPTLDNTINDANLRTDNLESRLTDLEQRIAGYKRDMKKHRPGTAGHNTAKRRALQALRQKKSLEGRVNAAANAQFNLEQVRDAQVTQRENVAAVHGMKQATVQLKKENDKIDLDVVEEVQDDMQQVLEDVNEVNEVLGRQYDVDVVDQSELEAELEELEDDAVNFVAGESYGETPSVLPHHAQQQQQQYGNHVQQAPPQQQQQQQYQYPAYANPHDGRY